jgi:hypothetical protein
MRPHRSLEDAADIEEVILRIGRLDPQRQRRWGKMTAHQMLCHLSDSFLVGLGERHASPVDSWWSRNVIKWIALRSPAPWPKDIPTRPEVDQYRGGTRPEEFARDRARVVELMRRFVQPDTPFGRHPIFGAMKRDDWLRWGYRHVDHHLRQFGL